MAKVICRILYIDDHEDSSEMLKILLADEDYEVRSAVSIKEALQIVAAEKFDLYVLDRNLPDGSGLELCARLTEATPGIPCIFYSGDAYDIHRSEALAAGADEYVTKPDIDGLINAVHKLMSAKHCAAALS
jgi:two-component system OmpR family response regulator